MVHSITTKSGETVGRELPEMSAICLLIYRIVRKNPGIHFAQIEREAKLSSQGLANQLRWIRKHRLIVEIHDGGYKRFFIAGDQDYTMQVVLARFTRPWPRKIARLLLSQPMELTEMCRNLKCSAQTLSFHLKHMIRDGDLQKQHTGRYAMYSLTNPELVRKMLAIWIASDMNLDDESVILDPDSL